MRIDGRTYPLAADFTGAARRNAREYQPEEIPTLAHAQPGQIRGDGWYDENATLRPEQNCCAGDPWTHGYTRDLGHRCSTVSVVTVSVVIRRSGATSVLVLQLPERLSLSLFACNPAP